MAARMKNSAMIIPEVIHAQRTMTKRNKIIYWISTIWLASGMLSTGVLQLFKMKAAGAVAPPGVEGITHLGYPILENPGSCSSAYS